MNEVLSAKKLFVFDMDGTIYLGGRTFPFAVDFINRLRDAGRKVLFFTNNASHSKRFYIEKLTRMGFSPGEGEILSSGHVTIEFLMRRRAGKTVRRNFHCVCANCMNMYKELCSDENDGRLLPFERLAATKRKAPEAREKRERGRRRPGRRAGRP